MTCFLVYANQRSPLLKYTKFAKISTSGKYLHSVQSSPQGSKWLTHRGNYEITWHINITLERSQAHQTSLLFLQGTPQTQIFRFPQIFQISLKLFSFLDIFNRSIIAVSDYKEERIIFLRTPSFFLDNLFLIGFFPVTPLNFITTYLFHNILRKSLIAKFCGNPVKNLDWERPSSPQNLPVSRRGKKNFFVMRDTLATTCHNNIILLFWVMQPNKFTRECALSHHDQYYYLPWTF